MADDMVELHRLTQEQMTTVVRGPFVTFVATCPSCRAEVPLPSVVVTPVLEATPGSNRLTVRLTEIASVEHTCEVAAAAPWWQQQGAQVLALTGVNHAKRNEQCSACDQAWPCEFVQQEVARG